MVARFHNVSKSYQGKDGIRNLNFELRSGEIVGLLGLNGSGKTTSLKLLSGLLKPDHGEVHILNSTPRTNRDSISYLGDKASFYSWMRPIDIEKLMKGLYRGFSITRYNDLLEKLSVPHKSMSQMSKGQAQRLRIAATMAREAKLYLLDEPLSGIDLVSREIILKHLSEGWSSEATVIISTHEIKEVQSMFHRALYLREGTLVGDVSKQDLEDQSITFSDYFLQANQEVPG